MNAVASLQTFFTALPTSAEVVLSGCVASNFT